MTAVISKVIIEYMITFLFLINTCKLPPQIQICLLLYIFAHFVLLCRGNFPNEQHCLNILQPTVQKSITFL